MKVSKRSALSAAGGALALIVVAVAGQLAPAAEQVHRSDTVVPVTSQTMVCPRIVKTAGMSAELVTGIGDDTTTLTATTMSGARVATPDGAGFTSSAIKNDNPPMTVIAKGDSSAAVTPLLVTSATEGQSRGLAAVSCQRPSSDLYFAGGAGFSGTHDQLELINVDPAAAVVNVTLYTDTGLLDSVGAGISLAANSERVISLDSLAPGANVVAIHVQATTGRVAASLLDQRALLASTAEGIDWVSPTTAPSTDALIPGFEESKAPRSVVVANPGQLTATVAVRVFTSAGTAVPSELASIDVSPGSAKALNISEAMKGAAGAVEVTSDQPVIAGASVGIDKGKAADFAYLPAVPAITDPIVIPSLDRLGATSSLVLVAPSLSGDDGQVSTTPLGPDGKSGAKTTVDVPVASAVSVKLAAPKNGGLLIEPSGRTKVFGAISVFAARGSGKVDRRTAIPLRTYPASMLAPPVQYNDGVVTRDQ